MLCLLDPRDVDLRTGICREEDVEFVGPGVDQHVGQDWQRLTPFDDATHLLKGCQKRVPICDDLHVQALLNKI